MTAERYDDGTVATHPDVLDTRPSVAAQLGDVMDRAIDQLDSPASFIPAVHDPKRDAVIEAAEVAVDVLGDEVGRTPAEFWPAFGALTRAVQQMRGAA